MNSELCAGVVAIDAEGHIGLIRASHKEEWVLPKGHVEDGEMLTTAALREAMEEMGVGGWIEPTPPVIVSHFSERKYKECDVEGDKNPGQTIHLPEMVVKVCKITHFFRMRVWEVCEREEKREMLWCDRESALKHLNYASHKQVVQKLLPGWGMPGYEPNLHLIKYDTPDIGLDVPGQGANP